MSSTTNSSGRTQQRDARESRGGRGRGRGGRKLLKTGDAPDRASLVHNVPFLKHGGAINQCMLWNLRVADHADTEELDIGQEIRTGDIVNDQEKLNEYPQLLQDSMVPIKEEAEAQALKPRQRAQIRILRIAEDQMSELRQKEATQRRRHVPYPCSHHSTKTSGDSGVGVVNFYALVVVLNEASPTLNVSNAPDLENALVIIPPSILLQGLFNLKNT